MIINQIPSMSLQKKKKIGKKGGGRVERKEHGMRDSIIFLKCYVYEPGLCPGTHL